MQTARGDDLNQVFSKSSTCRVFADAPFMCCFAIRERHCSEIRFTSSGALNPLSAGPHFATILRLTVPRDNVQIVSHNLQFGTPCSTDSRYRGRGACGGAKEMISDIDHTTVGQRSVSSCVSLGRCVVRRNADSDLIHDKIQKKTPHGVSGIPLQLHSGLSRSTRTQARDWTAFGQGKIGKM